MDNFRITSETIEIKKRDFSFDCTIYRAQKSKRYFFGLIPVWKNISGTEHRLMGGAEIEISNTKLEQKRNQTS